MAHPLRYAGMVLIALIMVGCDLQEDGDIHVRLRGTVTEADSGQPLDSVEVELGYWRFDTPLLATMITGEDGRYFLEASVSRAICKEDGIYRLFRGVYEGGPILVEMLRAECIDDEQVLDVALAETEVTWKAR